MKRVMFLFAAVSLTSILGCASNPPPSQPDVGTDVPIHHDGAIDTARTDGGGFAGATPITVDANYTNGTLADPNTSRDYYKFTGRAGQAIVVATKAKINSPTDPFDATYVDLVVTIYDSTQTAIALQDDPWPHVSNDPQLYTVLPTAGDYYVTVEDCNSALRAHCFPVGGITHKDYSIAIFDVASLGQATPVVEGATDQDGTTANAIPIVFNASTSVDAGTGGTIYVNDVIAGGFQTGTDIDVYSFTVPTNYEGKPLYRATAAFYLQIPGVAHGDGSTANMKVWIVDAANPTRHLAEIDQSNYGDGTGDNCPAEINVPVTPGNQYYLNVQNGHGAAGARDFYFLVRTDDLVSLVRPDGIYLGPTEAADATNGDIATPEVLAPQAENTEVWYGVAGDIGEAGTDGGVGSDVDYYSVAVPTSVIKAKVMCQAQRIGSGLRGFKFTLMQTDGTEVTDGTATEKLTADLWLDCLIPTGVRTLILKVEAASQDPNVSGTYYRCQVQLHS